jgi:hypothetical protein
MKWAWLWIGFVTGVLLCHFGHACGPNQISYEGVCADNPQPEKPTSQDYYKPSDELPPKHPEPAWQRGDVIADTPASKASDDAKQDQEKAEADAQGKAAAGIKN